MSRNARDRLDIRPVSGRARRLYWAWRRTKAGESDGHVGKRDRHKATGGFERKARGAFALAACLLAAALAAVQAFSGLAPAPAHSIGQGPSSTSGLMMLGGAAIGAWCFTANLRCSDAIIRRNLTVISALLVFWLLDVLVKYPAEDDWAVSMLWYLYYVPMQFVPTLFLASACRAAALDVKPGIRRALSCAYVADAVVVAMILTNNVHHLAFAFDFSNPNWGGEYVYGWVYGASIALQLSQYLCFFVAAVPAARKQLRSAFVPLLVIVGVGAAYSVLYILRHTAFFSTNIALVYCTLAVVALELSLDLGIFPSYLQYGRFFEKLPFDVRIRSKAGDTVIRSDRAQPLSPAAESALAHVQAPLHGVTAFRTSAVPSTLFKLYPITGGEALLVEDVSEVDARRAELSARQERLKRANALLVRDREVKHRAQRQKADRALFDEIERALSSKTRRIEELLAGMPEGSGAAERAERRETLMEVKLLVAYCKRKGGLVIAQECDPDFDRERLQLAFNETASDLRSLDIDCAALVETSQILPAAAASMLYDCLYDFAAAAFSAKDPVLMLYVRDAGSRAVEFRAALEMTGARTPRYEEALGDLRRALGKRCARFTLSASETGASLAVVIRWEE